MPSGASIAASHISALEQGDGLVNGLLEQPFWEDYLKDAYLEAFTTEFNKRDKASGQLTDLLEAHREWSSDPVTPERQAQLRAQLITLANELVIPQTVVLAEQPLSDAVVIRLYDQLKHDYEELGRRLTRDALKKAGL